MQFYLNKAQLYLLFSVQALEVAGTGNVTTQSVSDSNLAAENKKLTDRVVRLTGENRKMSKDKDRINELYHKVSTSLWHQVETWVLSFVNKCK